MSLEAYLNSLGCGIPVISDGLSDAAATSHFDMSSGNLSAFIDRMAYLNANLVSADGNSIVLNNSTNSGLSVRSSSLVMDAKSPLVGASHFHIGGSTNMDSYLNLPSSPLSFSSNNLSPSVIHASSKEQPTSSLRGQSSQLGEKKSCPQLPMGGTATSQTTSQAQRGSHHTGKRKEPGIVQMSKKPRLDRNQENILHQNIIQHLLLQKQDPRAMPIQDHARLLQALMQQHKLRNQQQQQRHILQKLQQQQVRHHLQQQANRQISVVQPHDGGICSRRLMQYIYHLRHRPPDNSISYWRKFVAEYYAPGAKERWCLSLYDNIGGHALGVFSRSAVAWQCDICGSKSGKGFEAIFEILPRLSKIKFESGVIDELLFLDFPHEVRFPSGLMMLRYGKAVQESIYEQFRVVRDGQLRIIFSPDLKILSWEFCARHHEELVPRNLVAPQVNQLMEAAQKCQSTAQDVISNAVSAQSLQSSCNVFVKAGSQLTGNLELLLVNDLGFSKRYIRCFQIAEVVNNMQELMTFSCDNKIGPIESLRIYHRKETTTNNQAKQMHETGWLTSAEVSPVSGNYMRSRNSGMNKDGMTTVSEKAGLAIKQERSCSINSSIPTAIPLPILGSQSSTNSSIPTAIPLPIVGPQSSTNSSIPTAIPLPIVGPQSSINTSIPTAIPLPILGPQSSSLRVIQSSPACDSSTSQLPQDTEDGHQRMIQILLQQMMYNSRAKRAQSANTKVKEEVLEEEFDGNPVGKLSTIALAPANVLGSTMGRSDYFKAGSNSNFSGSNGENTIVKRETDIIEKFDLREAVHDMDYEFFKNGVLNDDWRA